MSAGIRCRNTSSSGRRNISNTTADFMLDEETNSVHIQDGAKAVIGGIIEEKKIKYTKNDKVMAFLQVEDLVGYD